MSAKFAVSNKLPGKTISVLTHRKRRIQHGKAIVENKKKRVFSVKSSGKFRRAESFIMAYLKSERTQKRMKQVICRTSLTKPDDRTNGKVVLVMRHAGKKIFDETTMNILKTLRMSKRQNAVFLKNNKENSVLLKLIEPFVVYGYPTISTIRDLVFKKGFVRVAGKNIAIQSNTLIEEHLGDKGIICLEDIIHELFTVGPHFDDVNKFLCPFLLSSPRDGWNKVSVPYARGGEYGNRKNHINQLIARCL